MAVEPSNREKRLVGLRPLEDEQKPAVRSVTIPEVEYQLVRRIAYKEERTQQDVLAEAVRVLFAIFAKNRAD